MFGNTELKLKQGKRTINVSIGWDADEDRDTWELAGWISIQPSTPTSKPDNYELRHLESASIEGIYTLLQEQGFLSWKNKLPAPTVPWWSRANSPADPGKAIDWVCNRAGLCKTHALTFRKIVQFIKKTERPKMTARDHYFGY